MIQEPKSYWLNLLRTYLVDGKMISIQAVPKIEEQQRMAAEEKERLEKQIKDLGENGLEEKQKILEQAIEFNDRPAPDNMLTSVDIPSINSINFHTITRYSSSEPDNKQIDLSTTPVFTYFDHVKTEFVYVSN